METQSSVPERLAAHPLAVELGLELVADDPLHPIYRVGEYYSPGPDAPAPFESELLDWLAAQRRAIAGSNLLPVDAEVVDRVLPLVVVPDRSVYVRFFDSNPPGGDWYSRYASYSPKLDAVLCSRIEPKEDFPLMQRHVALHASARALLAPLFDTVTREDEELWIWNGLADWFSLSSEVDAASLTRAPILPSYLNSTRRMIDQGAHDRYWIQVDSMVNARGIPGMVHVARKRVGTTPDDSAVRATEWTFALESVLWMHFLRGEGDAAEDRLAEYISLALAGDGGSATMLRHFGFESAQAAEQEFFGWLSATVLNVLHLRLSMPEGYTAIDAGVESLGGAAAAAAPSFDPFESLALAFDLVKSGRFDTGAELLEALHVSGARPMRAGPDLERAFNVLTGLRDARLGLVEKLVADQRKLRLPRDGTILLLEPIAFDGETISFQPGRRHGVDELPLGELTPAVLALNFKKKSERYGAPWLEGVAAFLAGEPEWRDALPEGDDVAPLRTDLEALVGFELVASTSRAIDAEELTDPSPTELHAMAPLFRSGAALAHRRGEFDFLCRRALDRHVRGLEPAELIGSNFEQLEDGRVRMALEFESEDELRLFQRDSKFWKLRRRSLAEQAGRELGDKGDPTSFDPTIEVKEGKLVVRGASALRTAAFLGPPLSIRASVRFDFKTSNDEVGVISLLGCADERVGWVSSWGIGSLGAFNHVSRDRQNVSAPNVGVLQYVLYDIEARLGDGLAELYVNGESVASTSFADLPAGPAIIWFNSNHSIEIESFTVEGRLPEDEYVRLRQARIDEELQQLLADPAAAVGEALEGDAANDASEPVEASSETEPQPESDGGE